MDFDTSIVSQFTSMSKKYLPDIGKYIHSLSRDALKNEDAEEFLKSIHTLKGGAGLLNLVNIHDISFKIETAISGCRRNKSGFSSGQIEMLQASLKTIDDMLDNISESDDVFIDELVDALDEMIEEENPDKISYYFTDAAGSKIELDNVIPACCALLNNVFLLRINLIRGENSELSPTDLIKRLVSLGYVADSNVDSNIESMDSFLGELSLIYHVIFSSGMSKEQLMEKLDIKSNEIFILKKVK